MSFRNTGINQDDYDCSEEGSMSGHNSMYHGGRYVYGQQTQRLYERQQERNANLQRECLDSLRSSVAITAETEEVSRLTAEKLNEQTETLHRVRDTTDSISTNLDTSQYLLNGMKSWWGSVWQMFTKPPADGNDPSKARKDRTQPPPAISSTSNNPESAPWNPQATGAQRPPNQSSSLATAGGPVDEFEETLNRDLSTITNMLSTIHGRAVQMNSTISYQTGLIDEVGTKVESNTDRMKDQRHQMNAMTGRKN
eukprot:Selendium_serpulae@DN6341_c0_g1_i10.p3